MPRIKLPKSIEQAMPFILVVVCLVCGLWIVFNEAVIKMANIGTVCAAGEPRAEIMSWLIMFWRILSVGIIIGVLAWAFMRAVKKGSYAQYIAQYTGWY
jgi:hypothetical protein